MFNYVLGEGYMLMWAKMLTIVKMVMLAWSTNHLATDYMLLWANILMLASWTKYSATVYMLSWAKMLTFGCHQSIAILMYYI